MWDDDEYVIEIEHVASGNTVQVAVFDLVLLVSALAMAGVLWAVMW